LIAFAIAISFGILLTLSKPSVKIIAIRSFAFESLKRFVLKKSDS
jgi:hypothetical protein